MMFERVLKQLGFNDKQCVVYVELLRLGKSTPALLAKRTKLNRTTVYSVLKELIKKGIVSEELGGKTTYVVASNPEDLRKLVAQQKEVLRKQEILVEDAITQLADLPLGTNFVIPKIRVAEDQMVKDFLRSNVDIWNESASRYDKNFWGFQDPSFVRHFGEWVEAWYGLDSAKGMKVYLLTNDSLEEAAMQKQPKRKKDIRQVRFWGDDIAFTATTWVIGDYVVMIHSNEQPFQLIEIYNPLVAHNLREVFKKIWKGLE